MPHSTGSTGQGALAGIGVLVTRPAHQAAGLSEAIAAEGGLPILFPTIAIEPVADSAADPFAHLADYQVVLFISPNAVEFAQQSIRRHGGIPAGCLVGAVGNGTVRALQEAGISVDIIPEDRFDSEGLLACDSLRDLRDRCVLVVRGEGGRALLGDTLSERGARVDYAQVYRRALAQVDAAGLLKRWPRQVQVVTATSNDILDNLVTLIGDAGLEMLRATPLVVISGRMVAHARELGCGKVILAACADSEAIVAALIDGVRGRQAPGV